MATKAKSTATTNSASAKGQEPTLGDKLNGALELFHGGRFAEAKPALEALVAEARAAADFGMLHSLRATLTALEARAAKQEKIKEQPDLAAMVHLNRHESEAALEVLEKALKADGENARFHFLKATALAQLEMVEQSADALRKAVSLDPGTQVLFRLEKDFDHVRYDSAFAAFERD